MTHNTTMDPAERRHAPNRRRVPRGGRRALDVPGRYPPVLVADSDDGARGVCVRCLERFGFQVEQAATGEAVVAIVERCRPHVAIAELTLPRDDEFQARMRAHGIPYIATATNGSAFVPPEVAAVLMKPFPLAALLNEVRRVLTSSDQAARGVIGPDWLQNHA
jgi:DNA-binding response OmpR family regulator